MHTKGEVMTDDSKYKELKKCPSDSDDFRVGPTYSMGMWHMYLDFYNWRAVNIPMVCLDIISDILLLFYINFLSSRLSISLPPAYLLGQSDGSALLLGWQRAELRDVRGPEGHGASPEFATSGAAHFHHPPRLAPGLREVHLARGGLMPRGRLARRGWMSTWFIIWHGFAARDQSRSRPARRCTQKLGYVLNTLSVSTRMKELTFSAIYTLLYILYIYLKQVR